MERTVSPTRRSAGTLTTGRAGPCVHLWFSRLCGRPQWHHSDTKPRGRGRRACVGLDYEPDSEELNNLKMDASVALSIPLLWVSATLEKYHPVPNAAAKFALTRP